MSRNQWIVILVLSVAAALILGCLGPFALLYLMQGFPSQPLAPVQPTHRPEATSTPTPEPPLPTRLATSTPPRVTAASLIDRIDHADGYDWRSATRADRTELCRWLAANELRAMGYSPGWSYYYEGLTAFYDTNEPIVLQQKISEIAAMLGLLSTQ